MINNPVTNLNQLAELVAQWRAEHRRIGLVPTMGALHEGHLALVRASQDECDVTLVTVFVNPTQFSANEDLSQYPRTLESDLDQLSRLEGSDRIVVFTPAENEIYPADFSTGVNPPAVAKVLEGEFRPAHFGGVVTIVLKLFHLAQADVAYFGQKDYQQVAVVRQMVKDLNVPVQIRVCPIVRAPDGPGLEFQKSIFVRSTKANGINLEPNPGTDGVRDPSRIARWV